MKTKKPNAKPTKAELALRDHYAGLAMQAILSKLPAMMAPNGVNDIMIMVARGAFNNADAMLLERSKNPTTP